MKITGLEIIPVSKYLFIRTNTDEGIHGTGETRVQSFLDGVEGVLRRSESYLLGKNPFQTEHHWDYLYHSMYFRELVIMSVLSATDTVLWGIKGKALGVPVYELLGGKCRDKVRSHEAVFCYMPEEMAESCANLKQKGYDAARLMTTGDTTRTQVDRSSGIYNSRVEGYIGRVRACREAMWRDSDLILEYHRSMDPCETIVFTKGVEAYRPLFLGDPIPLDSPEAMADAVKGTSIPVATGERPINIQEFEIILRKWAARHLRPDACTLGGLIPSKRVAVMAEVNCVKIVPHSPLGSVSTTAYLQLNAAIPNFAIQEFPSFYHQGNEAETITEPFWEEDGYIAIPDVPGVGTELAKDPTEKFPLRQRSIPTQTAYDDGVYDVQWNRLPKPLYYSSKQRIS